MARTCKAWKWNVDLSFNRPHSYFFGRRGYYTHSLRTWSGQPRCWTRAVPLLETDVDFDSRSPMMSKTTLFRAAYSTGRNQDELHKRPTPKQRNIPHSAFSLAVDMTFVTGKRGKVNTNPFPDDVITIALFPKPHHPHTTPSVAAGVSSTTWIPPKDPYNTQSLVAWCPAVMKMTRGMRGKRQTTHRYEGDLQGQNHQWCLIHAAMAL